ncbi:MAG: hypothetical protein GC181_08675 [Bacteroidetes bacterium]|nr:hypothetical protein [Bacteroidota bacterium]
MPLQKLLIKYNVNRDIQKRAIHPAFINRKLLWDNLLTEKYYTRNYVFIPRKFIDLRDLNLLLGFVTGLHHWSRLYVSKQIQLLNDVCHEKNVDLRIISPPGNPEAALMNVTLKWYSDFLYNFCQKKHICFINANAITTNYFEADGVHLNEEGHRKLGTALYNSCLNDSRLT